MVGAHKIATEFVLTQMHRLLSLLEVHGGGCAGVLRYVKRPPTNKIR